MALSVGVAMREWRRYCDVGFHVAEESSGGEEEEEGEEGEGEFEFAPVAAVMVGSKRTYGVFHEAPCCRKRSRVDDQLEVLRAAIPSLSCTSEKASILVGAYEYIEKLQRQVQELQSELEEEDERGVSFCEEEEARWRETVEVVRTEEGLKVHIQCAKRPRVLADIMELLESSGMSVEQVSIAYQEDTQFVFDCLGSEVEGDGIAADSRHVEACLRSLIRDDAV